MSAMQGAERAAGDTVMEAKREAIERIMRARRNAVIAAQLRAERASSPS